MAPEDPQTPPTQPAEPPSPEPSILGRILLALALMIGFYVLAIGIAAVLIWIPFAAAMGHITLPWKLSGFMIVGAGLILWSIIPRPDRFVPPGPRLDEKGQPRLFQVIREVAEQTGQIMPADVFLVFDMNAWVAQRGGVMGIGSSRVMGIGLPLLQYLTIPEMKAVLAHEFGHYHGGDTKVGPWIYKTRAAIGRTVGSLDNNAGFLAKPFLAYGHMFLRVTHAVSRRQEHTADALAARTMGAEHLRDALVKIAAGSQAFGAYCEQELMPAVNAGYLPPVAEGFRHFVGSSHVSERLTKGLADELASQESDPYSTHPPLPVRLQALGASTVPALPQSDASRSIDLIAGIEVLESEALASVSNPVTGARLRRIAWVDVAHQVMLPGWNKLARREAVELEGLTIGELHSLSASPEALRTRFGFSPEASEDVLRHDMGSLLGQVMQAALAREGWSIQTAPGQPVVMVSSKGTLEPAQAVRDVLYHKMDSGTWDRLCTELEISAVQLAGGGVAEPGEDLEILYVPDEVKIKKCNVGDTKRASALLTKVFGEKGSGFSDPRLYKQDLTVGPFLWDAMRRHPVFKEAPSPAVSKECPGCLLPLRLKRIGQRRKSDGLWQKLGWPVVYATFTGGNVASARTVLAERYHGPAREMPMMVGDLNLRLIPLGGTIEAPMFMMGFADRRLFMQFDVNAKLTYIDDYSLTV